MSDIPTTLSPAPEAPQDDGGGRDSQWRLGSEIYEGIPLFAPGGLKPVGFISLHHSAQEIVTAVNAFESNKRLIDDLVAALEKAREFIVNGKEYGYIRMPDPGSGDTALNTVPVIDAALSKAKAKPGEQK